MLKTKDEIKEWLKKMNIGNNFMEKYFIHDDLTVDIKGQVKLDDQNITELPIQFGIVSENFYCRDTPLLSLKGMPHIIGGHFFCSGNQLVSLEYFPQKVGSKIGGCIDVSNNKITSLKGLPKKIYGTFNCHNNKLKSLEYCPKIIPGYFTCHNNQLISLKHAPNKIDGNFNCYNNNFNIFNAKELKKMNITGDIAFGNKTDHIIKELESYYDDEKILNMPYEEMKKYLLVNELNLNLPINVVNNKKNKL